MGINQYKSPNLENNICNSHANDKNNNNSKNIPLY